MKEKRFLLAIAALSLLATSCVEDINIFGKNDKSFQFKVTTDNGPAVKSGSDVWAIAEDSELEVGDMKLTLSATASYNRMDPFTSVTTKGTVLNNGNLAEELKEFDLFIPKADIPNVKVAAKDDVWSILPTSEGVPVWPEEYHDKKDMPFIAYTGGELDSNDNKKFTYTSPVDESDQIDLLYAYTEANKNDVAIHFYHALSAVRFIVDGLKDGRTVTSVKIKSVADSGEAEYNGNGDFAWTPGDTNADFTAEDAETCTFFVIPQSVEGISFVILINDANGNEYSVDARVPDLDGGWKAGYFYTYNISGGEGTVDVEVSETFNAEEGTKEHVGATNTGKLQSYVRAIVLANWYNAAGKVVAPYTGTITYNTTDWAEVDDIYYHKAPVTAGATSKDLISSFSVDDSTAPTTTGFALHLEMKVMVQAVEYDKKNVNVQAAWPEASSVYPTPTE